MADGAAPLVHGQLHDGGRAALRVLLERHVLCRLHGGGILRRYVLRSQVARHAKNVAVFDGLFLRFRPLWLFLPSFWALVETQLQ